MMKKFRKTFRSNKGQIGEILVVVILIILAVLGIVKYVMPMFDKNKEVASSAGRNMDTLSKAAAQAETGVMGDILPGQSVINVWNKYCNDAKVTITFTNGSSSQDSVSETSSSYELYENTASDRDKLVDRMANYKVTAIELYGDGTLKKITYTKQ